MAIDYKVIGSRIKQYRKSMKITQEELAETLDISPSYESRVERGATNVSLEMLVRISEALNAPLTAILSGTMESSDHFLDEELSSTIKNFSPGQKRLLLDIAKSIEKNIQQ